MSEINSVNEREGPTSDGVDLPQLDLSGMLGKLLANPQIIESVATALSGKSEGGGLSAVNEMSSAAEQKRDGGGEEKTSADIAAMAQRLPEIINMLAPAMQSKGGAKQGEGAIASDKRACLLAAMKPYMSPQRCAAIDYIIKFSQISEILKKIN